jgi:flavin reductase (DIM6/NTAB) family NADH-FMN oxidoreductase RutF
MTTQKMTPPTPDDFKQVMRRWASTVTVITTKTEDLIYGLTVTAFSSLTADPPEVFVSVYRKTRTHPLIVQSGIFCVNFLAPDMVEISNRFAGRMPDIERFAGMAHHTAATGAPVLDDAIAFLDCELAHAFEAADHTIFVGRVRACGVQNPDATPLLYFNGKYRELGGEVV